MKKWLKRLTILLIVSISIPTLLFVIAVYAYLHTIRQIPGNLNVAAVSGLFGRHVNPFIGTGGVPWLCAHNTPAASAPFGMARPGPDTASLFINRAALNFSGYYYADNKIIGFSNTRLPGAGGIAGGNFRVFPTSLKEPPHSRLKTPFARFSHNREKAFPGYYGVWLPKKDILVELTATPRAALHRYTFHGQDTPFLFFDITSAMGEESCGESHFLINPKTQEIEGKVRSFSGSVGNKNGLVLYFVARFSKPFASHTIWVNDSLLPNAEGAVGKDIGVYLGFSPMKPSTTVEMRLSLSCVSIANARENLAAEIANRPFESILESTKDAWEKCLNRIYIQGGTPQEQEIFYTALYRNFQIPTIFSDVNGEYTGFDEKVHIAKDFTYYTDFSLWDTFRTTHPLYNLIARDEQRDMMVSLLEIAKAGGAFPRWPAGCHYSKSMFGTPADMAVSEAYLKGIRNFDIETAYAIMRRTALEGVPAGSDFNGRKGLASYLKYGYCPDDKMEKSVSCTLEYAWADHALSLLAKELGKQEDSDLFARHAQFYRNSWNPHTRYFHPRNANGNFVRNFKSDILSYADFDQKYTRAYVEGSAEQWRWAVPFDPQGLIKLIGNNEIFVRELSSYLNRSNPKLGGWNPGPYYWHGNEPYFHAAYLFNEAGRPDLTQKWVRHILKEKYDNSHIGLDGNDDCGTLSAWYVFSAVGLYPIAGTTRYWTGAPLFERADLQMKPGTILTIIAENNPAENPYVKRVFLNDIPLDRPWLDHNEIADGGILRFEMITE
ncbi:MAG: GH92 family glycosyl hydrolase [Candidatus Hydrogenedentes bacterium]|nr:GH92 family glycosyl hydrolase [Candidatus Hydrogenedentota bacterium]